MFFFSNVEMYHNNHGATYSTQLLNMAKPEKVWKNIYVFVSLGIEGGKQSR